MAIYHLEGKIISRSQGRSAVAASAYRACERLVDERTGLVHDFTNKQSDLVHAEILLPKNAPKAFADRETLWQTVEATEKRKDAQLAREFNIALPRELSDEQNWALGKQFVQTQFVDNGMIADIAFHRGHKGQEAQPHLHVMLTMREVTPEGFGQKNRAWNDKALLQQWREAWAEDCNLALAKHGHDVRIDHRTLEAQGIDLEPQTKIGPKVAQSHLARLAEHEAKARANGERIIADPTIMLKTLTQQHSTFTQHDIARMVNRYTADKTQFDAAYQAVLASPELQVLGHDERERLRYTSREHFALETQLALNAMHLADREQHVLSPTLCAKVAERYTLDEGQQAAFAYLTQGGDMRNLVGLAGTGKTHLLGAVREAHEQAGYQVIGMTLAGKAAENLEHSAQIESRTVASYLAAWDNGYRQLTARDIVIVDEAGMLGSRDYGRIIAEAKKAGAKVITAFDPEQLQPINAGAAARAVAERTGYIELNDVRRQAQAWQREATVMLATGQTARALDCYAKHDNVLSYPTQQTAFAAMLDHWQEIASSQRDKEQLIIAHTRQATTELNKSAREIRKTRGELSESHLLHTARGEREFSPGDRVYFLQNEYHELEVRNGSLGTVKAIQEDRLTVALDKVGDKPAREITFSTADYAHFDYGYAATIHKGQGASVDIVHVYGSEYMDRHLAYVALSRHKELVNLYWDKETFKDFDELKQLLSRANTKDFTLDYLTPAAHDLPTPTHDLSRRDDASYERTAEPPREPMVVESYQDIAPLAEKTVAPQSSFHEQLERVGRNVGLNLSTALSDGDHGIYRGVVDIDDVRYGIIDVGRGEGKLVPRECLGSTHRNKAMEIQITRDGDGQQHIRATQSYEQELKLTRERGHDVGHDR
jgi:Ti-type conjugative transfer relaxase TraA